MKLRIHAEKDLYFADNDELSAYPRLIHAVILKAVLNSRATDYYPN
ncbi:hypothetical protein [Dyadobacter sp. NIV53]|nr:hypothetical protein [Dyadobacter sp. NIV53]